MNCRLEKIVQLSGGQATVYSVALEGATSSLFEQFLADYRQEFEGELNDIVMRLVAFGHKTGAREHFFKLNEGKPGDLVCALYDDPDKHLRLYCMRFGKECIILGGGGPKTTRTWQDDPGLKKQAEMMMEVSKPIHRRLTERDLSWSTDYKTLKGDLEFKDQNYD